MSDFTQALLISGGIFALVMARGYGRRVFDRRTLLLPVVAVAVFGVIYLKDAPISNGRDWLVYAAAIAVGLAFGVLAAVVTRLGRDDRTGRVLTVTGPAFVAVWLVAVVARLGFVWAITNNPTARNHFGEFMMDHHLDFATIAPFFLLWALTMVISRIVLLKIRERRLPQAVQLAANSTV